MNGIILASATTTGGVVLKRFPGWAPWAIIIGSVVIAVLIGFVFPRFLRNRVDREWIPILVCALSAVVVVAGFFAANRAGSAIEKSNYNAVESYYGVSSIVPKDYYSLKTDSDDTNENITFVDANGIESKGRFVVVNRRAHIYVGTGSDIREYGAKHAASTTPTSGDCSAYDYGSANGKGAVGSGK